MAECPYCGWDAPSVGAEIDHMNASHPEVIRERLERAGLLGADEAVYGFSVVDEHGQRIDPRLIRPATPQAMYPVHMTLDELRQTMVFIERQAVENAWDEFNYNPVVSILVRDAGPESMLSASWIEFSIGGDKYAIWRGTMAVYRVDQHGAVEDDPLIGPDERSDDSGR
jgi:hypothetical protein